MTLFIKACRILEPLTLNKEISETQLPSSNWFEFESSLRVEDVDIPLTGVFIHNLHTGKSEEWLVRPRDFEKARDWVFDTRIISIDDKPKLMSLLNQIEEDAELFLNFSW